MRCLGFLRFFYFKFVEFVDINIVTTVFLKLILFWRLRIDAKITGSCLYFGVANLVCPLFHGQRFNGINYQPQLVIASISEPSTVWKSPLSLPRRWPPFCWKSMRSATDLLWNVICWCVSRNSWGQVADTGPKTLTKTFVEQVSGFFLGKKPWKNMEKPSRNSAKAVVTSLHES